MTGSTSWFVLPVLSLARLVSDPLTVQDVSFCAENVPVYGSEWFSEVSRVLKPGGVLLLVEAYRVRLSRVPSHSAQHVS